MPFGNISTIYIPSAANAGTSQWGTDVRQMLDTADATSDGTTVTGHGTGTGATVRTEDPYTSNTTTDADQSLYGWAVTPTDMNSVAGAKRFYPAGNHVLTTRMTHNGTAASTGTLFMYVYRVSNAAGGRARTLLGNGSVSVSFAAFSASTTVVCTVAMPEVVFEPDETIQYSFELSLPGVAIVGHTAQFWTGTVGGVAARISTPTLGVLADTTGSATGAGDATGESGNILGTSGIANGSTTVSGVASIRADTVGTATGTGTAVGEGSSVAGTVGAANGTGTATGLSSIVRGTIGTVIIGNGAGGTTTTYIFPILD